jgi:CRP/FNR family transcriptional regulator, cyclic AMP receptor protein
MPDASFLESLDAEAREQLLSVAHPVSFASGATLARHGELARGAYVLREGSVEAVVTLPGGESLTVAKLGAGDVFGEMTLIELGSCTATIRATSPVEGWFIAHEDFRALVSQSQPAAIRLQHAITAILAGKVARLNAQLLACPAAEDRPARPPQPKDPLEGVARLAEPPFDARAVYPRLPAFERFDPREIEELIADARYLDLPQGHGVFRAGDEAAAAFIVLRGAVEVVAAREGRERRVAVLGPGQLVGFMSVLREAKHSSSGYAREAAVLMEFSAPVFRGRYFGGSRTSSRLRSAVQSSLLGAMARTNRALTRLISQAKLEAAHRTELQLETAYHAQLATTVIPA